MPEAGAESLSHITEPDISGLKNRLSSHDDSNVMRRAVLVSFAREHSTSKEEALKIARSFAIKELRAKEKGVLRHYHQMAEQTFEQAIQDGKLMSADKQKEQGRKLAAIGSRPDVVQFTRDQYDKNGKLVKPGLGAANVGGISLVFKPEIMDLPEYDCIGIYPNLPVLDLTTQYLEAVVVESSEQAMRAKKILEGSDLEFIPVKEKTEWGAELLSA